MTDVSLRDLPGPLTKDEAFGAAFYLVLNYLRLEVPT
jgi:hypothetical protein